MDMSIRSTRSESCSYRKYSCRKGVAIVLCLLLFVGILTPFAFAEEDYSYTEYNMGADLLAAWFEAGKINAYISSYTTDSGTVTNVPLTDYYIDSNNYIWFYNPTLTNYSDMGDKPSSGNAIFNVYIDFGFSFYFPPQNFYVGSIANANSNVAAYTDNSKVNLVRGANALYSLNSTGSVLYTASYYNSYLTNFQYMYNLINGTTVTNYKNMRHRYRVQFNISDYYGDGNEYFDSLSINYNVRANNQATYRVPMIGMHRVKLLVLNNPGAPSQDINTVVAQLDHIKQLMSDGNATQAQIFSAVSSINQTLTVPTSEQVQIESQMQSIADHEISDITVYESILDQAESFFQDEFGDVTPGTLPSDPAFPQDNVYLDSFFDHRLWKLFFPMVALLAVLSYVIYRWL